MPRKLNILFPSVILTLCQSAARQRGLETDLKLKGQEFPTLLSILYVGYIIMQIPS